MERGNGTAGNPSAQTAVAGEDRSARVGNGDGRSRGDRNNAGPSEAGLSANGEETGGTGRSGACGGTVPPRGNPVSGRSVLIGARARSRVIG